MHAGELLHAGEFPPHTTMLLIFAGGAASFPGHESILTSELHHHHTLFLPNSGTNVKIKNIAFRIVVHTPACMRANMNVGFHGSQTELCWRSGLPGATKKDSKLESYACMYVRNNVWHAWCMRGPMIKLHDIMVLLPLCLPRAANNKQKIKMS